MPATDNISVASPWHSFRVDNQLTLSLPSPPRQLPVKHDGTLRTQGYMADDAQAVYFILRTELPEAASHTPSNAFYTSITQAHLTSMKAIRISQEYFKLGATEGIQVKFRIAAPVAGQPATGTLWTIQLGRTVYLVQWQPKNPENPDNRALQQRFHSSWTVNSSPLPTPTPAQIKRFQTGRFRDLDPALNQLTIVRTTSTQTEVDTRTGLRIVYAIKWTDEGYDLTQRSSNSAQAASMQDQILRVRVTSISGDIYSYWTVVEGFILTGKMQRVN